MKNKKGFTLIELLIVIAIIGILATVVLVNLSSARDKAKAANFKSQVASIHSKGVIACDGAATDALTVDDLGGSLSGSYTIADPTDVSCGQSGSGSFQVVVTSDNGLNPACTGTITQGITGTPDGVVFSGC